MVKVDCHINFLHDNNRLDPGIAYIPLCNSWEVLIFLESLVEDTMHKFIPTIRMCMLLEYEGDKADHFGDVIGGAGTYNGKDIGLLAS